MIYFRTVIVLLLCNLFPPSVLGNEALWSELNIKILRLYQHGEYQDAVKVATKALEVAEETFGTDHPKVAVSLNNLSTLYRIQGRYTEAEPLYKQALTIKEKVTPLILVLEAEGLIDGFHFIVHEHLELRLSWDSWDKKTVIPEKVLCKLVKLHTVKVNPRKYAV